MNLNDYIGNELKDFQLPKDFSEAYGPSDLIPKSIEKVSDYCIDPPLLKTSALVGSILGFMYGSPYILHTPVPYIIPFSILLNSAIQYKKMNTQIAVQSIPSTIAFFAAGFIGATVRNSVFG
jgi:hypothetical protein